VEDSRIFVGWPSIVCRVEEACPVTRRSQAHVQDCVNRASLVAISLTNKSFAIHPLERKKRRILADDAARLVGRERAISVLSQV
jgi:hypothetical protein